MLNNKARKQAIDADLSRMCRNWRDEWEGQYTPATMVVLDNLIEFLNRDSKRLRGSLAIESYYLHGGTDANIAMSAARVIELVQAYLLVMDDIQDQSVMRRGGPTVHVELAGEYGAHYGIAQGLNVEMLMAHQAMIELMRSDVCSDARVRAAELLSQNLRTTIVGQINDVYNQKNAPLLGEQDIIKTLSWKTAYYTFVSPLELGACLTGVDGLSERLRKYAMNAGIAFQIGDDILGTFGNSFESGKSINDDIREGKATLLTVYAREHADETQRITLDRVLGNPDATELECQEVRQIILATGAKDYVQNTARNYADTAVSVLGGDAEASLISIVQSVVDRRS